MTKFLVSFVILAVLFCTVTGFLFNNNGDNPIGFINRLLTPKRFRKDGSNGIDIFSILGGGGSKSNDDSFGESRSSGGFRSSSKSRSVSKTSTTTTRKPSSRTSSKSSSTTTTKKPSSGRGFIFSSGTKPSTTTQKPSSGSKSSTTTPKSSSGSKPPTTTPKPSSGSKPSTTTPKPDSGAKSSTTTPKPSSGASFKSSSGSKASTTTPKPRGGAKRGDDTGNNGSSEQDDSFGGARNSVTGGLRPGAIPKESTIPKPESVGKTDENSKLGISLKSGSGSKPSPTTPKPSSRAKPEGGTGNDESSEQGDSFGATRNSITGGLRPGAIPERNSAPKPEPVGKTDENSKLEINFQSGGGSITSRGDTGRDTEDDENSEQYDRFKGTRISIIRRLRPGSIPERSITTNIEAVGKPVESSNLGINFQSGSGSITSRGDTGEDIGDDENSEQYDRFKGTRISIIRRLKPDSIPERSSATNISAVGKPVESSNLGIHFQSGSGSTTYSAPNPDMEAITGGSTGDDESSGQYDTSQKIKFSTSGNIYVK